MTDRQTDRQRKTENQLHPGLIAQTVVQHNLVIDVCRTRFQLIDLHTVSTNIIISSRVRTCGALHFGHSCGGVL